MFSFRKEVQKQHPSTIIFPYSKSFLNFSFLSSAPQSTYFKPYIELQNVPISHLNHQGLGIIHSDETTLFAHNALPSENGDFHLFKSKRAPKNTGIFIPLSSSPHRSKPKCEKFLTCGGCSLQHMDHIVQIATKLDSVLHSLRTLGKSDIPLHLQQPNLEKELIPKSISAPLIGSQNGYKYRRTGRFAVRAIGNRRNPPKFKRKTHRRKKKHIPDIVVKKDFQSTTNVADIQVGFRALDNPSKLAPISSCPVLHPAVIDLPSQLTELISQLSIPSSIPQIEFAVPNSHQKLIIIRQLDSFSFEDINILTDFSYNHGFEIYLQPGGPSTLVHLSKVLLDSNLNNLQGTIPDEPQFHHSVTFHSQSKVFLQHPYHKSDDIYSLFTKKIPPISFSMLTPIQSSLDLPYFPQSFLQVNHETNSLMIQSVIEALDLDSNSTLLDLFGGLGNFSLSTLHFSPNPPKKVHSVDFCYQSASLLNQRYQHLPIKFFSSSLIPLNDEMFSLDFEWFNPSFTHCIINPPRTGARALIRAIASSDFTPKIVYVSCQPSTFCRDAGHLLNSGKYEFSSLGIIDNFAHTSHVECIGVFTPR